MTNQYYYYVIIIYFLCFRTFMDVLNVVIKIAKFCMHLRVSSPKN